MAGYELARRLSSDGFCSVWVTEREEDFGDCCIRIIPTDNLISAGTRDRFKADIQFWLDLTDGVVDLYDCGCEAGRCYSVMRFMSRGAAHEREGGTWPADYLVRFAGDFAAALQIVHEGVGPHGNLKPSNVFPVSGGGALLSDFMLPLWLDELEAGSQLLIPRVLHPFRSPEQHDDPRDYDTRSDVYSFGLILLWCVTGNVATPESAEEEAISAEWPPELAEAARRCLRRDRDERFADGTALMEALMEAGVTPAEAPGDTGAPIAVDEPEPERVPSVPLHWEPMLPGDPAATHRLHEADVLVQKGMLDEAVRALESLPPGTEGMERLLNEIESRQDAGERLADEAVRLAGMGKIDAAADALEQAERLWRDCETVRAVRQELKSAADRDAAIHEGRVPQSFREAMAEGRFDDARELLERVLRDAPPSEEVRVTVAEFKHERVRRAFLSAIHAARRSYLLGRHDEAKRHWLRAAAWLPPGPSRNRLQRIARSAGRGKLRIDGSTAAETPEESPASVESSRAAALERELQAKLEVSVQKARQPRKVWLLLLLGAAAIVAGALVTLILYWLGD